MVNLNTILYSDSSWYHNIITIQDSEVLYSVHSQLN